jgi:diguanylate cyclase (GGDEF)-like protein
MHADGPARVRTILVSGLIVAFGLSVTAIVAVAWHANAVGTNTRAFQATASDLGSALEAKLGTNVALTRTIRARAAAGTEDDETRFLQWYRELQRGAPSPPDVMALLIERVTASRLPAFRRRVAADPAFRALLGSRLQVIPRGTRPIYCLTRAIVGSSAVSSRLQGLLDYCATAVPHIGRSPYPALVRAATDTAGFVVTPVPASGKRLVAIGAAVYSRGAPIATPVERRAAVTGFVATTFSASALIRSLLGGHSALTLALYHRNAGGSLQMIGRAGANPLGQSPGYIQRSQLSEGWVLQTTGRANAAVSAGARTALATALGLLLTGLILLLYRVLSGSRQRAWSLVGEKTGELEYSFLHDPLTDLPNRGLVLDRAEQLLARARRMDVPVTALFVDIDAFKQINDRHGRQVGDEVLRQVGARLKTVLRDNDTVGRLGADEFGMLVDPIGLRAAPELVAERILDVLRQPIIFSGDAPAPLSITASIGIATGRPASAENLMQDADLALLKAKAIGKNGYVKFESAMQIAAQDRMRLETDLMAALQDDQLFLIYQPLLDLQHERVVNVEALLRWRHPLDGVIPPDVFIPIAEENGLIVAIGRWVLDRACTQGAAWQRNGYPLNISVNVSGRQLDRAEFVEEVRGALHSSGLDPSSLTLEITETVLMRKPDVTARLLAELKALGVRIAVDDFGTGYSSLAYLRQFPVDALKIDRTFITGLALSSEARVLTHTLIQLGKALGLQTVAEGVEDHLQVRELQREGCDLAQGFLFSRPLPPEAVEDFVCANAGLHGASALGRPLSATHS